MIQFIIITSNLSRKLKMQEIFKKLENDNISIIYLEASVIENSKEFISGFDVDDIFLRKICCVNSHIRAIRLSKSINSPEFSIILEDDVTFIKENFIEMVFSIVNNWKTKYNDYNIIHIGWIPMLNYSEYEKIPVFDKIGDYKLINTFYPVGLQGYIVSKEKIDKIDKLENFHELLEIKDFISYYIFSNKFMKKFLNESQDIFIPIDILITRLFNDSIIIFPPLVIERKNEPSLLGHNNQENFWNNFFQNHEEKINNYIDCE